MHFLGVHLFSDFRSYASITFLCPLKKICCLVQTMCPLERWSFPLIYCFVVLHPHFLLLWITSCFNLFNAGTVSSIKTCRNYIYLSCHYYLAKQNRVRELGEAPQQIFSPSSIILQRNKLKYILFYSNSIQHFVLLVVVS